MSKLFSPLKIRSLTLKNRIFVSPMCQYSCCYGVPDEWHLVHLGSRAVGGAALVMAEATAVTPEGRISPSDCGLWNDEQADAFVPIVDFIAAQGAALAPAKGGWQPCAPSSLPFSPESPEPHELKPAELEQLCQRFEEATRRARQAGFQVVELHMAHGYLLHQFLSPLTNLRSDQFGGTLDNRMRFPLQVAQRVRDVWPEDLPVFVRISATDWVEKGWDLEQSLELCRQLKQIGIDLIDCSSAGLVPEAPIPEAPGFQTPMAAKIRTDVGIATGAVGMITAAVQAEQIVSTELADAVFLARELLRDPYWPLHAAQTLKADVHWPVQYERAKT